MWWFRKPLVALSKDSSKRNSNETNRHSENCGVEISGFSLLQYFEKLQHITWSRTQLVWKQVPPVYWLRLVFVIESPDPFFLCGFVEISKMLLRQQFVVQIVRTTTTDVDNLWYQLRKGPHAIQNDTNKATIIQL